MKFSVLAASVLVLSPLGAAAADSGLASCNQLGREVALRAAEQMQAGLDAAARTELAAIAEAVCVEFAAPAAAASNTGVRETPAAEPAAEHGGLLDLEVVPPEERVRRPGLKRL